MMDPTFQGCVGIKEKGKAPIYRAYGYADMANRRENTPETMFPTASLGKTFVAVGILRLVEQGRLHLDSTLRTLDDIDWHTIDRTITVQQLLTHTSGIPDYFDEAVMDDYAQLWKDIPNYRIRSSADLIPLFIEKPMQFSPGTGWAYNNTGFVVLALFIEHETGTGFDTFLQEELFGPTGMDHTGYWELDRLPPNCANGYIGAPEELHTNIYSIDAKGTGAGGAYTTVGDIQRFWDALMGNRLLSPTMTEAMLAPKGHSYGYGIATDGRTCTLRGEDPGVSAISRHDRKTGATITVLSNTDYPVAKLARRIGEDPTFSISFPESDR